MNMTKPEADTSAETPSHAVRRSRAVLVGAAIVSAAVCGSHAGAAVIDGFEGFTGASGTTVNGYAGWGSVTNAVVNNDATAFDGTHYLELQDTTTTALATSRKTFTSTPVLADGASISFALRDDPDNTGFNNNQVVIYGSTGTVVLQTGMKTSGTGAVFSYTNYTSGTSVTTTSLTPAVAADTWYLFNIGYSVNPTTMAGTYSLSITNESTKAAVYTSSSPLAGQTAFASTAAENITSVLVQTSVSGSGTADEDTFALTAAVPEPASISGMIVGAGMMLARRRRAR